MKRVRWIHQEDDSGCAFAALAMITGKTYEEVKTDLLESYHMGLEDDVMFHYLSDNGFFIAQRKRFVEYRNMREDWKEPFASLHLCKVLHSHEAYTLHAVVMLGDGTVLDPASQQPKTLDDYARVIWIAGVHKPRLIRKEQDVVSEG